MLIFRKFPHKPHNSLSILSRFFKSQNPEPFPDVPTSAYYDELVNSAGRAGVFDTVRDLLNKRFKDGCFNTTNTFKFITNKDEASLPLLLDELTQTLSRLDKGFTRKSAFDSLVARLCKLNQIDLALRVVEKMASGGYGLNACTFHPILNVLTRNKEMERAWCVVNLMREFQITPDLTAYNYFLMAYCFVGDLTSAAEVLTRMEMEGVKADTRTYDALVLGACKTGKVEGAFVLLRSMVDDGIPALLSTHMYVINVLLKLGYYAQAVDFVRCFAGRDTWMDKNNFGGLASKLIDLKRFDEAKLVLDEMKTRDLEMEDKLRDFYQINFKDKH
jgi:pentatricopeptide repeat protein